MKKFSQIIPKEESEYDYDYYEEESDSEPIWSSDPVKEIDSQRGRAIWSQSSDESYSEFEEIFLPPSTKKIKERPILHSSKKKPIQSPVNKIPDITSHPKEKSSSQSDSISEMPSDDSFVTIDISCIDAFMKAFEEEEEEEVLFTDYDDE